MRQKRYNQSIGPKIVKGSKSLCRTHKGSQFRDSKCGRKRQRSESLCTEWQDHTESLPHHNSPKYTEKQQANPVKKTCMERALTSEIAVQLKTGGNNGKKELSFGLLAELQGNLLPSLPRLPLSSTRTLPCGCSPPCSQPGGDLKSPCQEYLHSLDPDVWRSAQCKAQPGTSSTHAHEASNQLFKTLYSI